MTPPRVDVVARHGAPLCPRCGGNGLLHVRVPYGWTNAGGTAVGGRTGVVLCGACDTRTPGADALTTWFHVNGSVEAGSSEEFARLLVAWAEQASAPPLEERHLEEEIELWRRGEL